MANSVRLLVDMDGVLTDFVSHICQLHGRDNPYLGDKHLGLFDMDKIWGMSASEFWSPCGYEFWSTMDWMPDGAATLNHCEQLVGPENVCILTAPCATAGCVDGKRDWIANRAPEYKKRVLIGSCKEFLACDNNILIDDRDENVQKFREAGGCAFLVPRPWNSAHDMQFPDGWLERVADLVNYRTGVAS